MDDTSDTPETSDTYRAGQFGHRGGGRWLPRLARIPTRATAIATSTRPVTVRTSSRESAAGGGGRRWRGASSRAPLVDQADVVVVAEAAAPTTQRVHLLPLLTDRFPRD